MKLLKRTTITEAVHSDPVSYTHLKQGNIPVTYMQMGIRHEKGSDQLRLSLPKDLTSYMEAVSYTHLDVYKRQVWGTEPLPDSVTGNRKQKGRKILHGITGNRSWQTGQ